MKSITVHRQITADPAQVWSILTDPARLLGGGLGILRLEGTIASGQRIRLESIAAPGRLFTLTVAETAAPHHMVWASGAPLVFAGRRRFTLTEKDGGTHFQMTEQFRGLMLPLIWRSMPDLQPGFDKFADGLKRLAEEGRP